MKTSFANRVLASLSADAILTLAPAKNMPKRDTVVVLGASTGGTEAIKQVLSRLPLDSPPIVIAQHMPAGFTQSFAERLDASCRVHVKEAEQGDQVLRGHVYIAPGHSHILVVWQNNRYVLLLDQGPEVNRHRPAVDVLFRSAANQLGSNAIGVLLTGMGRDGARGMLEMRQAGAYTIAQDEASCVVYGMPKAAVALGAVHETVALSQMAERILNIDGASKKPQADRK